MATLYITSNGNSGTGTLRALLSSASAGDVIQPDASVFPAGTVCEIELASNLSVTKGVTICGAQSRIRLTASGAYSIFVTAGAGSTVVFEDCDFVGLLSNTYGGAFRIYGPDKVVCRRCLAVGNRGKYGGFAHVANVNSATSLMLFDSAFYGNYASTAASFVYFQGPIYQNAFIENCTYAANVCPESNAAFNYTPPAARRPNVVTNTSNWVVPPSESYSAETWTKDSWLAMNPRPVAITTNATTTASLYDLDGNFRREERDANAELVGGALGAYELIQADLFWIGIDREGGSINQGSFDSSLGWATSPYATECGDVAPQAGQTLYFVRSASFINAPPDGSSLIVAPRVNVLLMQETDRTINITLGMGATLDSSDKNVAIESPVIKNATYSQLLVPVQQTVEYPAESLFCEGYIADFTTVASNSISCCPEYGRLVILGVDYVGELYYEIAGVYRADTIVIRANGSGRYVLFGERVVPPVAVHPEFYCRVFTAQDIEWGDDSCPRVFPREACAISASNFESSKTYYFIVDMSEAIEGATLSLTGQRISNVQRAFSLAGKAEMVGETYDDSLVTVASAGELTLFNCVVVGDSLEVVDYALTIDGGSVAPTTIVVRSTTNSFKARLALDDVSGLSTIWSATINNAEFQISGGDVTFNSITTVNAELKFINCAGVRYDSVVNQADTLFDNVESASFGGFAVKTLRVNESTLATSGSISGTNVYLSGATVTTRNLTATETLTLDDSSVLNANNITFANASGDSATINFSYIVKGTTGSFTECTLNGGTSSRLSVQTLTLNNTDLTVGTLYTMTGSDYIELVNPEPTAPFTATNGSITCASLLVHPTETYRVDGTCVIESADIRGTLAIADDATFQVDAMTIADTAQLVFPNGECDVFDAESLVANRELTISANTVTIGSLSYVAPITINAETACTLTYLTPSNNAKITVNTGRIDYNSTREEFLLLDFTCREFVAVSEVVRIKDGSTITADTMEAVGIFLQSGSATITANDSASLGSCAAYSDEIGTLTINAKELTTTSCGNVKLVVTGASINLGSVDLCNGTSITGSDVVFTSLASTLDHTNGSATIQGTDSIAVDECDVALNLTLIGGAITGVLNATSTGYIHATATNATCKVGSGVTLECESLQCTEVKSINKPTSIVATGSIQVDEIEVKDSLALNAPLIKSASVVVDEDETLSVLAFTTASFDTAVIDGEVLANGRGLTMTDLTVAGELNATLTGAFNSDNFNSTGSVTVNCQALNAGVVDIDKGTTKLIATDSATADDVDVTEGATLRIEPCPSPVESLIVKGTLQVAGPGSIQVRDSVELTTVENVGSGRVEILLSDALDNEPTFIGDVIVRVINGTASDFRATAVGANSVKFTFKAANEVPCTIEVLNDSTYRLITRQATPVYANGEYECVYESYLANVNGKTFRLYDGAKYLTDIALTAAVPSFFTCTEKKSYCASRFGSAFFAARVIDSLTGDLLTSEDVESANVTVYKVERTTVSSYQREPIAHWSKVAIEPQILDEFKTVPILGDEFNFIWIPDQSVYALTGMQGAFAVQVRLKLTDNRNPVSITFDLNVQ